MAPTSLLLTLLSVTIISAYTREILVDDDSPSAKASNIEVETSNQIPGEAPTTCHMEYQVMKRVVGQCIKLGRSTKGCVAGNYLHPYHPECM